MVERCPELTPNVPTVEETHKSQSWFIHTTLLDMGEENDDSRYELRWTTTNLGKCKHKQNNERGKQGRDFKFHVYVLLEVLTRCIRISHNIKIMDKRL